MLRDFWKLTITAMASAAFALSADVNATEGFVKGQIEMARTHDGGRLPAWAPPMFWFTLKSVNNAGSCLKMTGGTILFASKDKQALSMILTAQAPGLEVAVKFNDSILETNYCLVLLC